MMPSSSSRKIKSKDELHPNLKTIGKAITNPKGDTYSQSFWDSLRDIPRRIDAINEEAIKGVLYGIECTKDIRKNQKLFDLVQLYFGNSFLMSDLCIALGDCLKIARDRQLILRAAVKLFKGEEGSGTNKDERYERALEELKKFKSAENPFTTFSRALEKVRQQQQSLFDKLRIHNKKIKKKLQFLKVWQGVSGAFFMLVALALLICQVVVALAGEIELAEVLVGAAAATSAFGEALDSQYKSDQSKLKREMELISSMKKSAFDELNDLGEIHTLVDQLEMQLQSITRNANFALEGEEKIELGFEEIEKSMVKIENTLEELGECTHKCWEDLKKGREDINNKINHY